jgi:hypothetical protein
MGFKDRKKPEDFYKSGLSEESAEDILAVFLDHYNIYPENYATKGEVTIYESSCKKLIEAIRLGNLEIESQDGSLKVIHTCRGGSKLEYREITNEAKLVDQGAREAEENETMGAAMSRRYASVMGFLSGMGYDAMKKLKGQDIGIMEALGFLLLGL